MASQLRTIRLYGELGRLFGREFRLAVTSTAEAVRALTALVPGFGEFLAGAESKGMRFAVFLDKRNIDETQLAAPTGRAVIRIAPIYRASKSGILQTILGAVLIVASFFVPVPGLFQLGVSMFIGGIVQMLSPHPKTSLNAGNTPSYNFNGPVQTEAQGHPVPVGYGRLKVGGAVASAGITAADGIYVPTPTASGGAPSPGTGVGGGGGGGAGGLGL